MATEQVLFDRRLVPREERKVWNADRRIKLIGKFFVDCLCELFDGEPNQIQNPNQHTMDEGTFDAVVPAWDAKVEIKGGNNGDGWRAIYLDQLERAVEDFDPDNAFSYFFYALFHYASKAYNPETKKVHRILTKETKTEGALDYFLTQRTHRLYVIDARILLEMSRLPEFRGTILRDSEDSTTLKLNREILDPLIDSSGESLKQLRLPVRKFRTFQYDLKSVFRGYPMEFHVAFLVPRAIPEKQLFPPPQCSFRFT